MKKTSPTTLTYTGMCDASAAVCLDDLKFVVANDEDNVLHFYDAEKPGPAIYKQDISADLSLDAEDEVDIEGATALNDLTYWISSHGRNRKGRSAEERFRFFTAHIEETRNGFSVTVVDVYEDLVEHLVRDRRLQALGLDKSARLKQRKIKKLAPKKEGLNIEGLCTARDQRTIMIGFRNPRPANKALLVPLTNPDDTVKQRSHPIFGPPILLDLQSRGVRSIEYCQYLGIYLVVAGAHDGGVNSQLYSWSGDPRSEPKFLLDFDDLNPEALLIHADGKSLQVLSDDGRRKTGGVACKEMADSEKKSFRSILLDLGSLSGSWF